MPTTDWLSSLLEPLQLELKAGDRFPDIPLKPSDLLPINALNPLNPAVIQIIGPTELAQLESLSTTTRSELMNHIANTGTRLLIISDGMQAIEGITLIPVACTSLSSDKTLELAMTADQRPPPICRHGVFMDVLGSGVMLTGTTNIGKSELALELITRGHSLIADDAPCFSLISGNYIQGVSPEILREFLEVRGLGIVNVRAMFGDNAVKHHKILDLIIHLCHFEHQEEIAVDRLYGTVHQQEILGQSINIIELPVAEGRNLAVLVETAVRNYNLRLKGYNSANEFVKRQQSFMDIDTE